MSQTLSAVTPAHRFLARFGRARLSRWAGRHPSRVTAWTWPRSRGGTGGVIPIDVRRAIIEGALAEVGVVVNYSDFEPARGETYLLEVAA